jgi:hypothetical protein
MMMAEAANIDQNMIRALGLLKGSWSACFSPWVARGEELTISSRLDSGRFKLAALTNNHIVPEGTKDHSAMVGPSAAPFRDYFDVFLESSRIGLRFGPLAPHFPPSTTC